MVFTRLDMRILCFLLAVGIRSEDLPNSCSEYERETVSQRLGTKTPYRLLNPKNDYPEAHYEGCNARRIWSMVRHGTRNPNRRTIRLISTKLKEIRKRIVETQDMLTSETRTICNEDLELFRIWDREISESEQKHLVPEGVSELEGLAKRLKMRFPNAIPDVYRNESFRFKFTDTHRTRKSFEAFATGLFGHSNVGHPEPLKKDPILRFYKLCKRWSVYVDKNPQTMAEFHKFRESLHVRDAVRSVSLISGIWDLSVDDVHLMYTTCAFETAWDSNRTSPWCGLFNASSGKAFEFLEDLDYYHVDGYGSRINYEQACPALRDMANRIDPDSAEPPATFYFTHSGTILKLLAHLGIYRDDYSLTHDQFLLADQRTWRVSRIDAFASNIEFVLYNCTNGPHLLAMHQEQPVRLPGCPVDSDLCSLALFKSVFRDQINGCRFKEMCAIEPRSKDEL